MYEYGIFNDREKICQANGVSTDDPAWAWLWRDPIIYGSNIHGSTILGEDDIIRVVDEMNQERAENGLLETHGPVHWKRRKVVLGEWE